MFSVHIIVSFLPFFDGELRSSTATVSAGFPFRDVFVCYERVPCREKFLSFFASSSLLSLLTTLHVALALSLLSPLWLSGLPTANSVLCPSGVFVFVRSHCHLLFPALQSPCLEPQTFSKIASGVYTRMPRLHLPSWLAPSRPLLES